VRTGEAVDAGQLKAREKLRRVERQREWSEDASHHPVAREVCERISGCASGRRSDDAGPGIPPGRKDRRANGAWPATHWRRRVDRTGHL
jgi:hypothetical protein